jgi:HD-GYP domain-containing protein (c-di-GMP phosphodiesterase class II)
VAQVKLVLIRKLATALNCEWGCCVSDREGILWWSADGRQVRGKIVQDLLQGYAEVLKDVSENQSIRVKERSEGIGAAQGYCLMFGPLERDEADNSEVVVFGRGSNQPEFKSNDMMMIDSVLGHGGHVISNLRLVERLKTMSFGAVRALVSAIDKKDQYTCGHSERVGLLSRLIGKELGLSPEDQQDLEWAGLLHDVGKIGISDEILNKAGKLTDEEFEIIKQHPKMSYEVILPISSFSSVHSGVLYHHEVPDGTGYPEGLKGDAIPLMARIVHVADTFDALTSTRSYRSKFSLHDALGIMRKDTGTKLDSEIMPVFETAIQRFQSEQPGRFLVIFSHLEEQDD